MRSCHDAVPFCQPKASRWRCAKYDPNALIIFSPRSRNHGHECANIYYHSWPDNTPNFDGFTRQDGDFPWRFVSLPEGSYRHLLRAAVPCWYLARVRPHIAIRQKPNNLCMYRCKFFKNGAAEKKNVTTSPNMLLCTVTEIVFWNLEFIPHSPIMWKHLRLLSQPHVSSSEHHIFGWSTPHQGARANTVKTANTRLSTTNSEDSSSKPVRSLQVRV